MVSPVIKTLLFGGPVEGLSGCGGTSPSAPEYKIVAPDGMYHGVFANHYTDDEHLACFEETAGSGDAGKADISLRFMNFKGISTGSLFPTREAKRMRARGGTLYLVLEPGSGKKGTDTTHTPGMIISGKYDDQLEAFAKGCKKFNGPVFISFRAPRGTELNPNSVKSAYIYLYRKMKDEGVRNITWVWNVSLDNPDLLSHYPGSGRVDWISVSLYQQEGEKAADVIKRLDDNIGKLKQLDKPIMIEFGSAAASDSKAEFIEMAISKFKELGIKAFIANNVSQYEGSTWKTWSLGDAAEKKAYAKAIALHQNLLLENINTNQGYLEGKRPSIEDLNCSAIAGHYSTPEKVKRIGELKDEVKKLEAAYGVRGKVPLEYLSDQRLKLARAYKELHHLTENPSYLSKSIESLESLFRNPLYNISFGTKKYPYVDKYFDLRLELADIYQLSDNYQALNECKKVLKALKNKELLKAQNVGKNSVAGYSNRAKLIMGSIYYASGDFAEAEKHLGEVADWSTRESKLGWFTLWWRGENRDNLRYNAAKARLLIGFINLYKSDGDVKKALSIFKQILSWKKVGEEDGFMDLAFGALIGLMRAHLQEDPNYAKFKFNVGLPWNKINKYAGLKKAMGIEDTDLNSIYIDKWQIFLDELSEANLPNEQLEEELAKIKGAEQ